MKKVFCLHHPHFARPLFTEEIEFLMFICCQQSVECHVNKFTLNMPKKKILLRHKVVSHELIEYTILLYRYR